MNVKRLCQCLLVAHVVGLPVSAHGQALVRVPNQTMSLPAALPPSGYDLVRAFPSIRSFSQPVGIMSAPGETNRLFVLERSGRIRVIPDLENPERQTFLSLTREVQSSSGEQGLLGLAFHPDYQRNGTFFIFYTARASGAPNRLSRFQVDPNDPNQALVDSEVILFSQRDDAGNHNGGDLHFGPDGYLYVALGDEGAANDSLNNSQRLDRDFFAGILRIDVDKRPGNLEPNPHPAIVYNESGDANYSVPADNPYIGVQEFDGKSLMPREVRTEFWAVGLRNPWRMAFDSATGDLYTGDVGQGRLEVVDIIVKGGNYGWNYREGTRVGPNRREPEGSQFIDPILEYGHGMRPNQGNSITGGVIYRGAKIASLYGAYIFADYASGHVWSLHYDGRTANNWQNLTRETGISAFGFDPRNGEILVADFNSNRLHHLVQTEPTEDSEQGALPESLSETGIFQDLESLTPHPGIVPYTINAPFWSDGAAKSRWFSVPDVDQQIAVTPDGDWQFPSGTVWVKHFDLELKKGDPDSKRRLETRLIVKNDEGIYGVTYRWDETQEDAYLVPEEGLDERFIVDEGGVMKEQVWRYPSRGECLSCHTREGGLALGFNLAQLDRSHRYGEQEANQITALSTAGYFEQPIDGEGTPVRNVAVNDEAASLTDRVKSYLDSNCSQCHQPGGASIGLWDARLEVDLDKAGVVNGALANPSIHPARRVIVPGDPGASELLRRITSLGADRMPPLGSNVLDVEAIELLREWITQSFERESIDAWSERYFGSALDPRASGENDHDADGYKNLLEYRLGTDPTDRMDAWRISIERRGDGLVIRFPAVSDETLGVELRQTGSLDPESAWEPVELMEGESFFGGLGEQRSIERPLSSDGDLFFRVIFSD